MTTEILLCVYLPHCIIEPNQCNIEESNKHRIGWLKVDERTMAKCIGLALKAQTMHATILWLPNAKAHAGVKNAPCRTSYVCMLAHAHNSRNLLYRSRFGVSYLSTKLRLFFFKFIIKKLKKIKNPSHT